MRIVEFTCDQYTGNPVKGELLEFDERWIRVKLFKQIKGFGKVFGIGELRYFRTENVTNLKIKFINN